MGRPLIQKQALTFTMAVAGDPCIAPSQCRIAAHAGAVIAARARIICMHARLKLDAITADSATTSSARPSISSISFHTGFLAAERARRSRARLPVFAAAIRSRPHKITSKHSAPLGPRPEGTACIPRMRGCVHRTHPHRASHATSAVAMCALTG